MKYKYEKIDNIKPPFEESPFLILGTSCHCALEWLYNQVRQFVIPSKDELIEEYSKDRKDRILQLRQNTDQIIDERQIEIFYERGVEYLSNYYDAHQPFSEQQVFDTEQNLSFTLDGEISFTGKVDRLDIVDDTIIINDYKTNQKIPDDKHDYIKEQINLYGYGVKQLYASKIKTVKGRVYYLHFNKSFEWDITDDVIEVVKTKYVELSNEIEAKKALYAKGNTEVFEVKVGTHCDYCPFKVLCPAWKHQSMGDVVAVGATDGESIKEIIDKYKKVTEEMKMLEIKKDFYKEILLAYAKEVGAKNLFSDTFKASIADKISYNYEDSDEEQIISKLKEFGVYDEVLSINKNKLSALLKKGKINYDSFGGLIQFKNAPYISRVGLRKDTDKDEE